MAYLGVNVDHVATLRQARGAGFPDPVEAALQCEAAGAHSIVAHLREDRRHIQDDDVFRFKRKLKIKFNLEMSVDPEIVKVALRAHPDSVTFVPERRQERTTESGLKIAALQTRLERIIARFKKEWIIVSLFIDPKPEDIRRAGELGADAVEIHTGSYVNSKTKSVAEEKARIIERAVSFSNARGLLAHVGHGLDYRNTPRIAEIRGICEFNIGYAIISRAVFVGIGQAVREMKRHIGAA